MKIVSATFFLLFVLGCQPSSTQVWLDRHDSDIAAWSKRIDDFQIRHSANSVHAKKGKEEERILVSDFTNEELEAFIEYQNALNSDNAARIQLSANRLKDVLPDDKYLRSIAICEEKQKWFKEYQWLQHEQKWIEMEHKRLEREAESLQRHLDITYW